MCCQRALCSYQREGEKIVSTKNSLLYLRFILKTCGTTTPLDCIEELTRIVKEFSGFDTVEVFLDKGGLPINIVSL